MISLDVDLDVNWSEYEPQTIIFFVLLGTFGFVFFGFSLYRTCGRRGTVLHVKRRGNLMFCIYILYFLSTISFVLFHWQISKYVSTTLFSSSVDRPLFYLKALWSNLHESAFTDIIYLLPIMLIHFPLMYITCLRFEIVVVLSIRPRFPPCRTKECGFSISIFNLHKVKVKSAGELMLKKIHLKQPNNNGIWFIVEHMAMIVGVVLISFFLIGVSPLSWLLLQDLLLNLESFGNLSSNQHRFQCRLLISLVLCFLFCCWRFCIYFVDPFLKTGFMCISRWDILRSCRLHFRLWLCMDVFYYLVDIVSLLGFRWESRRQLFMQACESNECTVLPLPNYCTSLKPLLLWRWSLVFSLVSRSEVRKKVVRSIFSIVHFFSICAFGFRIVSNLVGTSKIRIETNTFIFWKRIEIKCL